jgi:hypothetical protein
MAKPAQDVSAEIAKEWGAEEMLRCLTILLVVVASNIWTQSPAPVAKEKSCRTHPQLIGRCFNVRGRLSVYNGAPALRIWKAGTRRMFGISEQRFSVAGYRNVPENIESQINQDVDIFGDFLVCPFTRPKPGEMQLVCVERAKNLAARKRE